MKRQSIFIGCAVALITACGSGDSDLASGEGGGQKFYGVSSTEGGTSS